MKKDFSISSLNANSSKKEIRLGKNLLLVLGLLSTASVFLLKHTLSEMYVQKNGEIITATLINAPSDRSHDNDFSFRYNHIEFGNRNDTRFYRKHKVGDTVSFFHLASKPSIFIPIDKTNTDFYIDMSICTSFILIGLYLLFYRFVILPKRIAK